MNQPVSGTSANLSNQSLILRDPYLEWVGREGIPVFEDFGVNLLEVQTGP